MIPRAKRNLLESKYNGLISRISSLGKNPDEDIEKHLPSLISHNLIRLSE